MTRAEAERWVIDAARYIMQPILWERASFTPIPLPSPPTTGEG